MKQKKLILLSTAISLIVIGIVLICTSHSILDYIIRKNFVLVPNSPLVESWMHIPKPLKMDIYFFNWTNSEDIKKKEVKPKVEEVGPYRFMLDLEKINVTWNNNGTVTYMRKRSWFFDEDKPNGNLTDVVTSLNGPTLSAAHMMVDWSYFFKKSLSFLLNSLDSKIYANATVDEFLFTGYPDTFTKMGSSLPALSGRNLPKWDRFGWFYKKNGSTDVDGVLNMGTGINSVYGQIYEENYSNKFPYYEDNCAKIQGSSGDSFNVKGNKKEILFFLSDLCRILTLDYVENVLVDGILGRKYVLGEKRLDNGTKYPENKCFCTGDCMPSGVFNLSSCRFGAPIFMSLPHFYLADPYYNNLVEGLHPDEDKHEFYFVVEPNTGIPIEVRSRLQLNVLLHSVSDISVYEDVPKVYFPIFWFDQQGNVPKENLPKLKLLLKVPTICEAIGSCLIAIGCAILVTLAICNRKKKQKVKREKLKESKQENEDELPLKSNSLNAKFA